MVMEVRVAKRAAGIIENALAFLRCSRLASKKHVNLSIAFVVPCAGALKVNSKLSGQMYFSQFR